MNIDSHNGRYHNTLTVYILFTHSFLTLKMTNQKAPNCIVCGNGKYCCKVNPVIKEEHGAAAASRIAQSRHLHSTEDNNGTCKDGHINCNGQWEGHLRESDEFWPCWKCGENCRTSLYIRQRSCESCAKRTQRRFGILKK